MDKRKERERRAMEGGKGKDRWIWAGKRNR
jgi:hypothetical protein